VRRHIDNGHIVGGPVGGEQQLFIRRKSDAARPVAYLERRALSSTPGDANGEPLSARKICLPSAMA
jgi:hypothetical protein